MRVIDFEQLVTVRPEAWGGEVAVQVRACTVAEYQQGYDIPLLPSAEQRAFLERHVRGISGLAVRGADGAAVPVLTVADVYEKLRPSDARELHLAVIRASSVSGDALGNSEPRRSGAESTAAVTAPTVDDEA